MESVSNDRDQHVTMRMTWSDFERFLAMRGESVRPRMTYLDGVLELMSPSQSHEGIKSRIGRLLELWAALEGVPLSPFGSTTLKKKSERAGAEPDECYVVGRSELVGVPDLAIEVNWSSSGIDKLEVYHRLGVREVWFWEDDTLSIFGWRTSGYTKRKRSAVLPSLDVKWLEPYVADPDHLRAVENFLAELRRN